VGNIVTGALTSLRRERERARARARERESEREREICVEILVNIK